MLQEEHAFSSLLYKGCTRKICTSFNRIIIFHLTRSIQLVSLPGLLLIR
ncbi:hypothetical protein QY97_00006 [Bacillus thermotolerans]|nr:hypothetical protein QY97_00006 [Bacillus thermotolerans]